MNGNTWFHRLLHRARLETQLDKELRFHLDEHIADLIARGHDPQEARRLAILDLGGPAQVKEECRDARGTLWLEDLGRDFRYTLRTLRQRPGFAAVALLTLALGAGATTVMFTVIRGVLLKPLPYADPAHLVNLREQTDKATHWGNLWAFTYPNYLDCRRDTPSLDLAAWRFSGGAISRPGDPEYVDAEEISAGLLPMLGVHLYAGRTFRPDEDRPGAAPVAIVSYALWQRRFAGNLQALGMPLVYEDKTYTIVGIAPPGFRITQDADLYTPLGQVDLPYMQNREAHFGFQVWGRLRPGATLAQARGELNVIGRRLAREYPKSNTGRTFIADPLRPDVGDVRNTLWLLLGAVTLVLLIACVNIASLLLARSVSREREIAMRMALGAGRGRLVRQCLTESAVLALAGGALGILIAAFAVRPFVLLWPGTLPRADEISLDWPVLLFALAVSLGSGLLFGLAPAIRVSAGRLEQALRAGARTVAGRSRRLHSGFVISEIALAVVLLVSAGILGRTLLRLSSLDPGVNPHNLLTARIALSPSTLASPARTRAAWQDIVDRAAQVPGVEAAAVVDTVPMREGSNQIGYWTTPNQPPEDQQRITMATSVTPAYLQVAGIRLLQGRFFNDHDRLGTEGVAVVDDVMAHEAFGSQNPVGQHLSIGLGSDPVRVIGIVNHVRYWGAADDDRSHTRAQLYYPFAQVPDTYLRRWSELMSIAVRTNREPLRMVAPLRRELRGAGADQVLYEVRTMDQIAAATLARQRFLLLLFGVFAALALLLACIGIYGVLSYLTGQRVPEIGVRMALGAAAGNVLWMVLRQSLAMMLLGIAAGTAAALAAARILQRLVDGVEPAAPSTIAIMIVVLAAAALFSSFLPARRASRIDPITALRQD